MRPGKRPSTTISVCGEKRAAFARSAWIAQGSLRIGLAPIGVDLGRRVAGAQRDDARGGGTSGCAGSSRTRTMSPSRMRSISQLIS